MEIVLVQEYAADWTYRCEEAVNLVLAYLDHLLILYVYLASIYMSKELILDSYFSIFFLSEV